MGDTNNGAPIQLISDRTWAVQGWHGTPLKAIGRAWATNPDLRSTQVIERADFFVSPGPEYTARMLRCFRADREQFWETGNPRNDVLTNATEQDRTSRHEQLRRSTGLSFSKIVLFAPTWREWRPKPRFFDVADYDPLALDAMLASRDAILVLRPHHREAAAALEMARSGDRLVVADQIDLSWDVNDWCIAADVLVTDFSSIFYDFLNLDRPIVHLTGDIAEYAEMRGFLVDPYDDLCGPTVTTQKTLLDALSERLDDTTVDAALREARNAVHNPLEDGSSTERVGAKLTQLLVRPRTG